MEENINTSEENPTKKDPGDLQSTSDDIINREIVDQDVKTSTANYVKVETSAITVPLDHKKAEACSTVDVDNITNSLAEKVIIGSVTNSSKITSDCNAGSKTMISEVVVMQETNSLKNLLAYSSSSSDEDEDEVEPKSLSHTINKSESESDDSEDDSGSDSSDSSTTSGSSSSSDDLDDMLRLQCKKATDVQLMSSGKTDSTMKIFDADDAKDLPSIRDVSNLEIDVEKEEFLHMGHIEAVIETLVTVEAIPGTPAYDLDTCLFIEDKTTKRAIGAIYDVIGPVTSPLYCIRFKNANDIKDLNVKKGMKVFCAPKSKYTQYVFVSELMRSKGTDASWVDDIEIPPEVAAQMSDDEDTSETAVCPKPQKRKHCSQERYRRFEQNMNHCNTLNSHAARMADAHRRLPRINRFNQHVQRVQGDLRQNVNFTLPTFDPTIPPPGFPSFLEHPTFMNPQDWRSDETSHPLRPPRCQAPLGQYQGHSNNDMNHGPGPSYHPY